MKNETLAERIREEHLEVRRSIQAIQDGLASSTTDGILDPAAVVEKLRSFEAHLREHFALEETEGPLSSAVTRTRRQEERANDLVREHPQFLDRLEKIVERLGAVSSLGPDPSSQVVGELQQLFTDLRKHEALENILFQEQVYDEHGEGD